jgi:aryl-alcohol dehydrogenase-like predicted oxidoreductase
MTFSGISLGCGNVGGVGSAPEFFGRGTPRDEAFAIMDRAWAEGIRWFDTADAYGGGRSEQAIGRWRRERGVHGLTVTTKVYWSTAGDPGDVGLAPARIRRQVEGSLERLGVDRIDLYLAHEPDPRTPVAASAAAFERLVGEGVVAEWGVSNVDGPLLREWLRHGRPALVQNSYSLLDRGDEADVIPLCAEHDIAYVPFGPLAGGWLTGKYRRGAAFPAGSRMTQRPGPYERYVDDRVFDGLERLEAEASDRDASTAALAFAWVLASPGVAGAVCGPNRADQLDPVLEARELALSPAERDEIAGLFS